MKTLTASDRSALIRLASELPKGSEERRAILAGLKVSKDLPTHIEINKDVWNFIKKLTDKTSTIEPSLAELSKTSGSPKGWYRDLAGYAFEVKDKIIPSDKSQWDKRRIQSILQKWSRELESLLKRKHGNIFRKVEFVHEATDETVTEDQWVLVNLHLKTPYWDL